MNITTETTFCQCDKCKAMCSYCPCMGTVEEIQALIDAGHGDKLMLREGTFLEWHPIETKTVSVLMPAIVGFEGRSVDSFETGECVFFSEDKCMLHDSGTKPIEGRLANHDKELSMTYDERMEMKKSWRNNPDATKLIHGWQSER